MNKNTPIEQSVTLKDFKKIRLIGKGTTSKVWLVLKGKDYYAMKIIPKRDILQKHLTKNVVLEQKVLAKIFFNSEGHPFINRLKYSFQNLENLFLILDFAYGKDLDYHITKERRFDERKTKFYAAELLLSLHFLSKRNIIHRDIKPGNILLSKDGHIRLTDFGFSTILKSKDELKMGKFLGTPVYMDPYTIKNYKSKGGKARYNRYCDVWSYGIIIYEMLYGKMPFDSQNSLEELFDEIIHGVLKFPNDQKFGHISDEAKDLISKLLKKEPKDRINFEKVFDHKFFEGIDWKMVYDKLYVPPFIPRSNYFRHRFKKLSKKKEKSMKLSPLKKFGKRIVDKYRFKNYKFLI